MTRSVLRLTFAMLLMASWATCGEAAISLFGSAAAPADTGDQVGPTVSVTPPGGMTAGDLVVVFAQYRGTLTYGDNTNVIVPNDHGGQAWSFVRMADTTNVALRVFWCRFNGAWAANPSFMVTDSLGSSSGTEAMTAVMLVFRPSSGSKWWTPDVWPSTISFTVPTSPSTVTIPGIATVKPSTVSIAAWATAGANTWDALTGAGWEKTALSAQYRNLDQSMTVAYQIKTSAGATDDVSQNPTRFEGGSGSTYMMSFAETDLPSGGSGSSLAFVQSGAAQESLDAPRAQAVRLGTAIGSGHGYVGYAYFEMAADERLVNITDDGSPAGEAFVIQVISDAAFTQTAVTFFRPNAGGTTTVTANFNMDATITGIVVHEVSGSMTLDALAGRFHVTQDAFVPDTCSPRSVTPRANGAYVFGAAHTTNDTPGVPYWSQTWGVERSEVSSPESGTATLTSNDTVQGIAAGIDARVNMAIGRDAICMMAALIPTVAVGETPTPDPGETPRPPRRRPRPRR